MKEAIQNGTGRKYEYEILSDGKVRVLLPEYKGILEPGAIYVRGAARYTMEVFLEEFQTIPDIIL